MGTTSIGERPDFVSQDREVLECQLRNSFILTDRNRDGVIDASEAPIATSGYLDAIDQQVDTVASTGPWVERIDKDGDWRVDWPETRAHLMSGILERNRLTE